jgi:hypothetical protein
MPEDHSKLFEKHRIYDEQLFKALKPHIETPNTLESTFHHVLIHEFADWNQVTQILEQFVKLGWDRRKLYEVTRYVQFNDELSEDQHDLVGEILGNLTGYCMFDRIIRLSNEPQGDEEFSGYFSRIEWGWE